MAAVASSTRISRQGQQQSDMSIMIAYLLRTILPLLLLVQVLAALSPCDQQFQQEHRTNPLLWIQIRARAGMAARAGEGSFVLLHQFRVRLGFAYLKTRGVLARANGADRKLLANPGFMPSWTPDGRIIFTSPRSGSPQIWIMDAEWRQPPTAQPDDQSRCAGDGANGVERPCRIHGNACRNGKITRSFGSCAEMVRAFTQIARGAQPSLARSGTWLSYTYETDNPYHRQIWRINTDGTGKGS